MRDNNIVQWGKVLATKSEDVNSIPRTHMESHLFGPQFCLIF